MTASLDPEVLWHDLECGGYRADLRLWLRLADGVGGPILDVGAGTGRVTLELAQAGHRVVALDRSAALLRALRQRARGLDVQTHRADARRFRLGEHFSLILVPMQMVQLLDGPEGRAAFLGRARAHLEPGGLIACALAGELVPFEPRDPLPVPDIRELDGTIYASRPVAVRRQGERMALVRVRETVAPNGERKAEENVVHLDVLPPGQLAREAAAHGLRAERTRHVAATEDYVASQVVMLRG